MHSFGNSFGFRRSNEHLHSGPQSARIPLTFIGLQGDLVTIDAASGSTLGVPYLKVAPANSVIEPGVTGLLVQYEEFITADGINRESILNTRELSRVRVGQLANIVTGAGLKIWLKNLPAVVTSGSLQYKAYGAETRITMTSLVLGDMVKWTGTVYARTTTAAESIGRVTRVTTTGAEISLNA